jgi:hypothetical protein
MDMKSIKNYAKKGIDMIKLKQDAMSSVAKDDNATQYALLFIALAGVAQAIGTFNIPGVVVLPVAMLIGSFIGLGIMHILAKLFGGKAKFMEYFRAGGVSYVGMWIAVIPILGPIVMGILGLWYLVVHVVLLKAVHKLNTFQAIIVVFIPTVILAAIVIALVTMFAVLFAGILGGNVPNLSF